MASSPKLTVIRLARADRPPETLKEKLELLVREYRRIRDDVWPDYTEVIGECGVAAIAAEAHMPPISPNFLLNAARIMAQHMAGRVAVWSARPPEGLELQVIPALYEIPADRGDAPDFDIVVGRLVLRAAVFDPLEAQISPSDPALIRMWHQGTSLQTGTQHVADPRSWVWEKESGPTPPPAAKPRVIN